MFSLRGMNDIVFSSSNGGEKYPQVPGGSFGDCKLEQMNMAFVLRGRREGAKAAAFSKTCDKRRTGGLSGLTLVLYHTWLADLQRDSMNKLDFIRANGISDCHYHGIG